MCMCVGESGFAAKVAAPQRRINPPTRPTDPWRSHCPIALEIPRRIGMLTSGLKSR